MDVITWVIWRVKLHDPVYPRDVQTSRRHVGTEKDARFCVAEFKKRGCALLLLLFALYKTYKVRLDTVFVAGAHT